MIGLEMPANATCWACLLIVTNRIAAKTLAIAPARFIPFSSLLNISFSAFLAPVVVCLDGCLPSASASGVAFALLRFRSAAASDWLEICCSCLSFPSSCCGNFELSSAVHVEAGLRSGWGVAGVATETGAKVAPALRLNRHQNLSLLRPDICQAPWEDTHQGILQPLAKLFLVPLRPE